MFTHNLFKNLNRLDFGTALKIARRKLERREKQPGHFLRTEAMERELADPNWSPLGPVQFLSNTKFKFGPIALTTTLTTNLFNPGTTTGGTNCTGAPFDKLYVILTHMRVVNKTGSAATVSLWVGATGANAAGTEFAWQAFSVAANSYENWYGWYRFGQADFLVGGAGTNTALSLNGEGEIGIGA